MPAAACRIDDPLAVAEAWMGEGRDLAIATLVQAGATSPLRVGRRLVLAADGETCGSLGDAGLDGAVLAAAVPVIATGAPCVLDFDRKDDHVRVYVERLG